MTKHEKIADALRMLGRGNGMAGGGLEARVTIDEVATIAKMRPAMVERALVEEANLVWGKLPSGWMHRVQRDGVVLLQRRAT